MTSQTHPQTTTKNTVASHSAPSSRPRPALFRALGPDDVPALITIDEQPCQLVRVLKHDSWAATALYQSSGQTIICKFHRQQPIAKLPMKWLGRWLARHEAALFRALDDLPNVPQLLGTVHAQGQPLRHAVAHTFVPGHPLAKHEHVCDDFLDRLRQVLDILHARNIAYVDLHKRENIIVGDDGEPYLVDFQISFLAPRWWPLRLLARPFLRILQRSDDYHLRKHVAHHRPDLIASGNVVWTMRRPWYIRLHRFFAVPFRTMRRKLLVLLRIRTGTGRVDSEHFAEEAVRLESDSHRHVA